jgi:hypothetical protein
MFYTDKENLRKYQKEYRLWQGIPGIERTRNGRLFATFYSGGQIEEPGNYVLLKMSDDDGFTWSDIIAVCDPKAPRRTFDPVLWTDPQGRLWWFWSQCEGEQWDGKGGVWYARCDRPDDDKLLWTEPICFANGVMMNKPTVLRDGNWLFPCAVWNYDRKNVIENERKSNVYLSADKGQTFVLYGQADVPERSCDEHMVLELRDQRLLMLVRTGYGIGKSYSYDGGKTWTQGEDSGIKGPCSRFFIRRLKSGRILLVNHYMFSDAPFPNNRNNLTAMLSEDEGDTWKGFLMLDERDFVSYPDGTEDENGYIYIIYDHERGCRYDKNTDYSLLAKEILMAKITEADILAGKLISKESRLRVIVDKL